MNIVLTGPMGSGKTTLGSAAAERLGREFVDTDRLIELRTGQTIMGFFDSEGEMKFREVEKQIVRELAGRDELVIATGGGAVLSGANMRLLRLNGAIINLTAEAEVLSERLAKAGNRPLFGGPGKMAEYLAGRAQSYANADFFIDTGKTSPEVAMERICEIGRKKFARICACVSGNDAETDLQYAAGNGATMAELRFDLMDAPDVEKLVRASHIPVIATDRKDKNNLKTAILAGAEFVDIEADAPERDGVTRLARQHGCRVIASAHFPDGPPDRMHEMGDADLYKVAAMARSPLDLERIKSFHTLDDRTIIVAMGEHGSSHRPESPLLGSYLTYCYVGKPAAPGQMELLSLVGAFKELGLR